MKGGLLAAIVLAVAFAGCMSNEPVESGTVDEVPVVETVAPPVEVALTATSVGFYPANPAYTMSATEVPAGANVTLTYVNDDMNPLGTHDWVLEGVEGGATERIGAGEETVINFLAPAPGEYVYICSVPGHRERGMEGTLTVV